MKPISVIELRVAKVIYFLKGNVNSKNLFSFC